MPKPNPPQRAATTAVQAVTKEHYVLLAGVLERKESIQRVQKKDPHGEALRSAGEHYENREYVAAYELFKPAYEKVVADMQRVLARNVEFEANKLAKEQHKPLAVAKEIVQKMKVYAQQVIDHFDTLRKDLESKALVRMHIKKGGSAGAAARPPVVEEAAPTTLNSASETRLATSTAASLEVGFGEERYKKAPYAPPEVGMLYCVRDKAKSERIVRVVAKSPDSALVQVEILQAGKPVMQPIELTVDSLARQAAKGWCSLLLPVEETEHSEAAATVNRPAAADTSRNVTMRLDIQNFSRCCADIVRANIKFDTQRIKDVADGPFRAGDFQQAFLTFEQYATGFNLAVGNSRRAIADGRRLLNAEKGKMSGKEIQDRTAAYTRNEHLIHTAEREFSTILEGLRMYLRAQQTGSV
jgi:hypothetical protein